MHADPLFLDLRIALGNAEAIRTIIVDHLRAQADQGPSLAHPQQVLLDAGLAQMIQSIYTAAENLLLKIAASIDGGTPARDETWHAALLARMAHDYPGRRPAVLSAQSLEVLHKLRGFRHVTRNTYAHELNRERLIHNAELAVQLLPLLSTDIDALERYMASASATDPPSGGR